MKPSVYLAGPMTGLTVAEAGDWRAKVSRVLSGYDIETRSPVRDRVETHAVMSPVGGDDLFLSEAYLVSRDVYDINRSELVLLNLLGAKIISVGSVGELWYCYARSKPVILVMEESGNPHEHTFVRVAAPIRFGTLADGVEAVRSFLQA